MRATSIRCSRLILATLLITSLGARTFPMPGRSVLTSEMLLAGGLVRITDIFLLAEKWHANTIDGFTWRAAPNDLSSLQNQGWVVLLDGHRYDLKTLDVINLSANDIQIFLSRCFHLDTISFPRGI